MYSTIKLLCEVSKVQRLPLRIFRTTVGTYYAVVYNFREEYSLVWRSPNFISHEMIERQLLKNFMKKVYLESGEVVYV